MREKGNGILLFFLLGLILISVAGMQLKELFADPQRVVISHDSGIYQSSIYLTIETGQPSTIYYTLNGEKPSVDDEKVNIYEAPVLLEAEEGTTTYSVQFLCQYEDGSVSEVFTRDYIIEEKGSNRFTTTYIVSITGDEESLFGYEEGLLVRGRQYDKYMEANPDVDILNTIIPANYFADTEIPVHVAFFSQNGTELLEQNCGFKIFGNVTRAKNQKSFRLIARYAYDDVNEFSYAFLGDLYSDRTNTPIEEFQRLSFHNSGNDNGYGFVRTQLIGKLASRMSFPDVYIAESATVYVNGRYQGVYWLQNTFDDRYFKEKYGEYAGEMVIAEGELCNVDEGAAETEAERRMAEEYNQFCRELIEKDLQQEDNWIEACEALDVENFAKYMAIEYYINNIDWPHNNVKVYRYYCEEDGEYIPDTVFDGRYRYLLFDTDYGMGLLFLGWYGLDETDERLESLIWDTETSGIFGKLLEREEFRNMFLNYLLCLMNESFSRSNVEAVLNELNESRYEELRYMVEESGILKNSLWESDENGMEEVHQEWEEILSFAEDRANIIVQELNARWGCGYPVYVSVELPCAGDIYIGDVNVGSDYEGYWLENYPMHLFCQVPHGAEVKGYYVNENYIEGESIEILPGTWGSAGENIVIEPVIETNPVGNLRIEAYHTEGEEDYVILQNNGVADVLLSEYCLSDSDEKLYKGKLPHIMLKPNEHFVVYGEKYAGVMEDNSIRASFSWNSEESVVLYHIHKGIVEIKER